MKKLLFDLFTAQPMGNSKFHGGGEYIKRIFMTLVENYREKCEISVFYDSEKFLDDYIIKAITECSIPTYPVKSLSDIEHVFQKNSFYIFYSGIPYFYGNITLPSSVIKIGTFHGLRLIEKYTDSVESFYYSGFHLVKPMIKRILIKSQSMKKWNIYYSSICKFDKVICDSEHSKYAIKHFFPKFKKDVRVFYAPAKYSLIESEKSDEEIKKLGKYILVIGLNRWEKNGVRALLAIDKLFENGYLKGYSVVTLGKIPKRLSNKLTHKDRIIQMGYVETDYMEGLYRNCELFVYPSLNEGFGMPPFEAMKYGKTCVVSAVCSLPELCGDAVYYANPYDIDELAGRVLKAIEDKIDHDKVISRYEMISSAQERDLFRICDYIVCEEEKNSK